MTFRRFISLSLFFLLLFNFFFMLYFGKEAFHIKEKKAAAPAFDYHFVLISEEVDNEYWRLVEMGARDAAQKYSIYLEYLGPKQADNEEQLEFIDKTIAGKVDGILTQGVSNERFNELANKAVEKGISFVTIDTDAPESERQAYVGSDNYKAGFLAGQTLIQDTQGPQYVGIVTGRFDSSNQRLRVEGFKNAIKEEPRIHLVDMKESNITKSGALRATYDLLREYPRLTAFYGTSALDAIGIYQVVKQFQLKQEPYIIGFDTLPETLKRLSEGAINATISQYPYQMGYSAVEVLLKLKQGEHPDVLQYTDTKVIRPQHLLMKSSDRKDL
jgi:ribose transport system substrate-binding protein